MAKNNAGFRLHRIAAAAAKQDPQKSSLVAWAASFGLPDSMDDVEKARRISRLLVRADSELEQLVLALRRIPDFDINEHQPHIQRFSLALQPSLLRARWGEAGGKYLKPETVQTIWWFGDKLGTDEPEVQEDRLVELEQMLAELDEIADDPRLPGAYARRLHRIIAAMREALWQVPVTGVGPLRHALTAQVTTLSMDAESIDEEVAGEELPTVRAATVKLGKMFMATAVVCGAVNEVVDLWQKIGPVGQQVVGALLEFKPGD